ncbi:hypothetical protein [Streptobacillus moniliformis]|nr:hypothetical protein [Streptobacillus moniliformis]
MELIFGGIIFLYVISILILMERNIKLDELNEKELEKYFEKYL